MERGRESTQGAAIGPAGGRVHAGGGPRSAVLRRCRLT